ncbi:MAG: adenosylcobalamin-dependent ribonucleoside-diphosphate reductase, partial [Candidatus Pacearchaeota archaeon]
MAPTKISAELVGLTELNLSENQIKVIKDKYLKNSPTVEHWLRTVCHNIALAEILYSEKVSEEEIFDGVNYEKFPYNSKGKTANMILLHYGLNESEQRDKNFKKFLANLEMISKKNPEIIMDIEEKFYKMLSEFKFLPNSPTLMNAGRDLQQLSACYVLPVEDSIEGIYESVKNMALIHKSGGGTGFSFSRLRPANDFVKTTHGISSGPISFMQIFDKSTDVVKQGGTRRGANMGILHYTHPDILSFIDMKKTPGVMENFNVSVTIDEKFMNAVKNNLDYNLINPRSKEIVGKLNARDVWKKLIRGAWETGDPGIIIIDRINNTTSNPTPHLGQIEATNPCGEQPLLPYEPCNLGSINLSKFVKKDGSDFDYVELKETISLATRFLDNVIDMNNYPIPKIEEMAKKTRRIGLGVMGWAESLVKLGIPYNSQKALEKAEEIMKFINMSCLNYSEELADKRGVFPAWKGSIYDKDSKFFRGQEFFPRHSARTTIAPTGTIGIAAGLQGAGIEPFFAIVYVRYNASGIEALKRGETPSEKDTFFEINPLFEEIAMQNNYWGMQKEELYMKINNNHKSLRGIKEIPENIQNLFLTSHDLTPKEHVLMQCAFQKYTDNAVSKTVNLKNSATESDVEEVYMLAYENGAKGVTIYRDGSKNLQVLNLSEKTKNKKENKDNSNELADYYLIETGHGPVHIHINYNEDGPTKIFANLSPVGTEISGMTTALSIVLSKYF